jgi:hypothetical protein
MRILEALASLDPQDDAQWTEEGQPNLDLMRSLTENEELTREQVTEGAPHFVRTNPELPSEDDTQVIEEEEPKETEEELLAKQEEGAKKLATAKAKYEAAKSEYEALLKEQDVIIEQLTETSDPPHVVNQQNIRDHIQRQQENRIERAKMRDAVLGKLKGTEVPRRAPIDESLAARKGRGQSRPEYPVKAN